MNYYSRNSPQKRKKDLPPGYLLAQKPSQSSKKSVRSRFVQKINLSQNHSMYSVQSSENQIEVPYAKNYQRDDIYIVPFDQILIEEQEKKKEKNLKNQNGEDFKISEKTNLQSSEVEIQQKQKREAEKELQRRKAYETEQKQKYFFRNNSFGDKQIQTSKGQQNGEIKKQPLIRKLINVDHSIHLQSISRNSRNKIQKQKNRLKSKQVKYKKTDNTFIFNKNRAVPMQIKKKEQQNQGWNDVVHNFIKKRLDYESSFPIPQSENTEKMENIQKQKEFSENISNTQVNGDSVYEQSDKFSQESAYFPFGSQQNFNNNYSDAEQRSNSQYNYRESSMVARLQQVKAKSPKNQIFISDEQDKKREKEDPIKEQNIEPQQNIAFISTTTLLEQTIRELPPKLVPTYLKIYKQLLRKQYETQVTIRRMKETQQMIRSLIAANKILVKPEDYILTDFEDEQTQKIFLNGEIILGLVRQLAKLL